MKLHEFNYLRDLAPMRRAKLKQRPVSARTVWRLWVAMVIDFRGCSSETRRGI